MSTITITEITTTEATNTETTNTETPTIETPIIETPSTETTPTVSPFSRVTARMRDNMSTAKPKVSVTQLRILLEAIERDPFLYNVTDSEIISFLSNDKWISLANKLNDSLDGADIAVSSWKFILRYWGESTKRRRRMGRAKDLKDRMEKLKNVKEARELLALEQRLYEFIKREDPKEQGKDRETFNGEMDLPANEHNSDVIKLIINLLNEGDENTPPSARSRKRNIVLKEDEMTEDGTTIKKFKIIFDERTYYRAPPLQHILDSPIISTPESTSRLEENISTIQARIEIIKELWKHRCGDN